MSFLWIHIQFTLGVSNILKILFIVDFTRHIIPDFQKVYILIC